MIGKVSFGEEKLAENFKAIYDVILRARPAAVKGVYMKNVVVSACMGSAIKLDVASI